MNPNDLEVNAEAEAFFKLGMRYLQGDQDVRVDERMARTCFLKASKLDHAEAQFELACLIVNTEETGEEYEWLERSANLGFGPALNVVASDSDLSDQERHELLIQGREWYKARAIRGDPSQHQVL